MIPKNTSFIDSPGRGLDYAYIALTLALTAYGQVVLKWRVGKSGALPDEALAKVRFLAGLLLDPLVLSAFAAAFLASLAWMAAMTRFELSHAYPFMALNFVLVVAISAWLFHEPVSAQRMLGIALIVAGTIVAARG